MFRGVQNDKYKKFARKRAEYPLSKEGDSWLEEVLNNETQKDVWIITCF